MIFWQDSGLRELLVIAALLLLAAGIRRVAQRGLGSGREIVMPDSMVAGLVGLGLGGLGWLHLDTAFLEKIVYHALAIVFIAIGLQTPISVKATGNARSMAVAIPLVAVLQGIIGLIFVLGWSAGTGEPLFPGFGLMAPLAFSQGPGQALSLGTAWESMGMVDGGQIGLIMASIGFGWCVLVGVPLISLARRLGWTEDPGRDPSLGVPGGERDSRPRKLELPPPGGMEPLTLQLVSIGAVYLCCWAILSFAAARLEGRPQIVAMVFGFHFILSGILAMGFRRLVRVTRIPNRLHDGLLGRVAGTTVDVATCAAFCAIELQVLRDHVVPILLVTGLAGIFTAVACVWLARRAFPSAPFEHAIVLFGCSTGTMPTGLALLRVLDPELKGPVATSAVLGASAAILFGSFLLLVVIPTAVSGFPDAFPTPVWVALGLMVGWSAVMLYTLRIAAPFRVLRPFTDLWPRS